MYQYDNDNSIYNMNFKMRILLQIFFIAVLSCNNVQAKQKMYFGAPNVITDWRKSCSPDKGSVVDDYPTYIFKKSKNNCSSPYKQRAEIITKKALSVSAKAKYNFQTIFKIKDNSKKSLPEKFDIFQIHDGRVGCAPPLKVEIHSSGFLRLIADYKTGSGQKCERNVIKPRGYGKTQIKRNGTEYKLNILVDFDGKSGFDIQAFLDNKLEINGKYSPPSGNKYFKSKYYFFKHGVYSKRMFDYELTSRISMKKVK